MKTIQGTSGTVVSIVATRPSCHVPDCFVRHLLTSTHPTLSARYGRPARILSAKLPTRKAIENLVVVNCHLGNYCSSLGIAPDDKLASLDDAIEINASWHTQAI